MVMVGKTDSPVELVEIILSHQPEISPKEKQQERTAQEDEPATLPLQEKRQALPLSEEYMNTPSLKEFLSSTAGIRQVQKNTFNPVFLSQQWTEICYIITTWLFNPHVQVQSQVFFEASGFISG